MLATLLQGNTIIDTPYGVATSGGSISTYVDSTASLLANANHSVIRNITVKNNVIKYPPVCPSSSLILCRNI